MHARLAGKPKDIGGGEGQCPLRKILETVAGTNGVSECVRLQMEAIGDLATKVIDHPSSVGEFRPFGFSSKDGSRRTFSENKSIQLVVARSIPPRANGNDIALDTKAPVVRKAPKMLAEHLFPDTSHVIVE